jgi:hypothetical protein
LAHAAAEVMGVLPQSTFRLGYANHLKQFDGPRGGLVARQTEMGSHRFRELNPNTEQGVEGGHRLLEHHGDPAAPDLSNFFLADVPQVTLLEQDSAPGDPARWARHEAQDGKRAHGLAATGLADDGDGLAGHDGVGDAVHGLDRAHLSLELDPKVLDLEQTGQGG